MSGAKTSQLMAIALNSNMRIHERINAIKKSDGKNFISNREEAKAILAIPNEQILITDNKEQLMIAKLSAQNYLKTGGKCLRDDLADLYHYCKNKLTAFIKPATNPVAQK